ncbi:hypothetical protein RHECNPAF_122100132 [Rhizobium etli CNPAF512]|nr:hypothetical protein RHECNPAF_122100132 [Rhizobium etli CNPAF512]
MVAGDHDLARSLSIAVNLLNAQG